MSAPLPSAAAPRVAANSLLIKLDEQADLSSLDTLPRGADRKTVAWNLIQQTAERSNAEELAIAHRLIDNGAATGVRTLSTPNMVVVDPAPGKSNIVAAAFKTSGVRAIFERDGDTIWSADGTPVSQPGIVAGPTFGLDIDHDFQIVAAPTDRPYGVTAIGAPAGWAQGATGAGLVYGSIDTGADFKHEAIANAYRGRASDGTVDHDYNWMDFQYGKPEPTDLRGHGTHVIGTTVGATVGVAPNAKWISARALSGSAEEALRAMEWMQAPTRLNGSEARPDLAPDVVGISWWMGRPTQSLFEESIRNLRGAGIEVVKSAGNQGPSAGTITSPGQYPEILSIGAVDEKSNIADFSSRGPAPWPAGRTTPKPDFAAPGVDVVSSLPGGRYGKYSGTSMAQPHASGALLAILSRYPQLTHDQLVTALKAGATDRGRPGVDAEYGNGILNIPKALEAAKLLTDAAPAA